jgi:hypothetical protein
MPDISKFKRRGDLDPFINFIGFIADSIQEKV